MNGEEVEIPTLVPTLSDEEINFILQGNNPTRGIVGKAVDHAKTRRKMGKSQWAD